MATITDSDSGSASEGLVKVSTGAAGMRPACHPPPVSPPEPTGMRMHGPRLRLAEPDRGFRRVIHAH